MAESETMMVLRCAGCGNRHIPPRWVCASCGQGSLEPDPVSGKGKVYTFTTIRVAPVQFKAQAPYDVVIVELEEGIKVTGRMSEPGDKKLEVGDPVRFVTHNEAGYWFRFAP
jgi:uncharacterized OB-fold protein